MFKKLGVIVPTAVSNDMVIDLVNLIGALSDPSRFDIGPRQEEGLALGSKKHSLNWHARAGLFGWNVRLTGDSAVWTWIVPIGTVPMFESKLVSVWEGAQVLVDGGIFRPGAAACSKSACLALGGMLYKNFLSISTSNGASFYRSFYGIQPALGPTDELEFQILMEPVYPEWYDEAKMLLYQAKSGKTNWKSRSGKDIVVDSVTMGIARSLQTIMDTFSTIIGGDEQEHTQGTEEFMNGDGIAPKISTSTIAKPQSLNFRVWLTVYASSATPKGSATLVQAAASSLRMLDSDNSIILDLQESGSRGFKSACRTHFGLSPNIFLPAPLVLSSGELAQMIRLPENAVGTSLNLGTNQADFRHIPLDIPDDYKISGLFLGNTHTSHGSVDISLPLSDPDIACLPHVSIGGMGSGKSTLAANAAVELFLKHSHSVVVIDVADYSMANSIRDQIPGDKLDQLIDINLADPAHPVALHWSELITKKGSKKSEDLFESDATRIADRYAGFLEMISDNGSPMGHRMRRWMKKAMSAIFEVNPKAALLHVMLMLQSDEYARGIVSQVQDPSVVSAWKWYFDSLGSTKSKSAPIMSPVMNRLEYLMDSQQLKNSFCQPPIFHPDGGHVFDFRRWINGNKPYLVIVRAAVDELGPIPADFMVSFIINKLWLAVLDRPSPVPKDFRIVDLFMDEPHQFMSASPLFRRMVVESRKWRLSLWWFFHNWEQIRDRNSSLAYDIKSAGVHYTLFSSSDETWRELKSQIRPFTVEDALSLPPHHAILCTASKSGNLRPIEINTRAPGKPEFNNVFNTNRGKTRYARDRVKVIKYLENLESLADGGPGVADVKSVQPTGNSQAKFPSPADTQASTPVPSISPARSPGTVTRNLKNQVQPESGLDSAVCINSAPGGKTENEQRFGFRTMRQVDFSKLGNPGKNFQKISSSK